MTPCCLLNTTPSLMCIHNRILHQDGITNNTITNNANCHQRIVYVPQAMQLSSPHCVCSQYMNVACVETAEIIVKTLRFNAMYRNANHAKNVQHMHMTCVGWRLENHKQCVEHVQSHHGCVICHRRIVVSTNNAVVTTTLCIYDMARSENHCGNDEIQGHVSRCK